MAAADTRRLHAARGRQIGRAQAHAVHARAGAGDGLHVLDALGRLQDGVDQDRLAQRVLGLELRQQLVEVVDVPGPFDLRQHDDVELGAGGRHDLQDVVERPGRVQRIDARPQARLAEVVRLRHGDETPPRSHLGVGGNGILEIAEHGVDLGDQLAKACADLFVVRRHEVDHALEPHRQLPIRLGCADGERAEMLGGRADDGHGAAAHCCAATRAL